MKTIACISGIFAALAMSPMAQAMEIPESVTVPKGNDVAMETVGVGKIKWACEAKDDGTMGWVFKGPDAALNDADGKQVGKYYGPPATWESMDGSKITGTQLAVEPNGKGNIPLQLVEANPAEGEGHMQGVTYVQRLNTQGGAAPDMACDDAHKDKVEIVMYQADYLFYKAM
nr:hypothetical protein BOH68_10955 [Cobetia sp. MM1IDA2H-1]